MHRSPARKSRVRTITTDHPTSDRAALTLLAEWLRCPICLRPLAPCAHLVIGCDGGHRFDVNKRGYVSLLSPRSRIVGDSREMLAERQAFLAADHYAPIADAICRMARSYAPVRPRIADLGCGTGYYLASLAESVKASRFLAADVSPEAVRIAVRTSSGAVGAVFDLWQPLPLRDGAADVILNVFAPRNAEEFSRVLSPGGVYIGVVPTAEHLHELHAAGFTLNVPEGKRESVLSALTATGDFTERATEDVTFTLDLEAGEARQLIDMGPSAHHQDNSVAASALPRTVTVSVTVVVAERGPRTAV